MEPFTLSNQGLVFVRRRHQWKAFVEYLSPDMKGSDPNTALNQAVL